jgi:signal transduction histidine kinase/ligand-binding sensor domain-containing protein
MNLQLLQPAIATHISGSRKPRAWRFARLVIVWFATCLFATVAFALDPQKAVTQFVHTAWTEKNGAPADIFAITQTNDGYLWLGTQTGLFSFDGVRFARFEPRAGEDLPATRIRMLLATRDGSLWILFLSGGVSRLLNGHVTSYSEPEGLPAAFALVECNDGSLIAGTAKGLARFNARTWRDVTREWNFPGKLARMVYFDRAGTFWALTEDRIVYRPSGQQQFVDPVEAAGYTFNFAEAPDGAIWISETLRSAHTVRRFHDRSPMTEVRVGSQGLLFDRNGGLWVSTIGDGLRRVAHPDRIRGHQIPQFGTEAEQFTAKDGLSGNDVYTLFDDREGNIWAGTSQGLDRFRDGAFTPVSIPHSDIPRGVLGTSDGSLWSLTYKEIVRIGPRGDHELVSRHGATSMFEDKSGVLWLASTRNVSRFQEGRLVNVIGSQHPLPGGVILTHTQGITRDGGGGIWLFDLDQGLFRLAYGVLTKIPNHLDPVWPLGFLFADRNGRILLGQYNHVAIYDRGKSQIFGTSDGVPPGQVCTIYHDRAGNVWAGGWGGLSKFENGHFHPLSKPNGLPAQSVFGMLEDDEGYWWIATDVGVLRIPAGELDRAVANPAYRVRYESFNILDGLPGSPRKTFPMPVVTRTTDGRIWFAATNGIAYVDPRRIPKNDLPPPVHVETVKVGDKVLAPADGIVLNHNTKDIEIDYTALSLSIPERVAFRYKLEDHDTEWQEPGTRRQAFYNDLRPGKYRFRVIACNSDGVWNEAGATLDFSVMPAWYQTMLFRLICIVIALMLMWAIYLLRCRQIARVIGARYDERLAERTRIARDLHDTLLQTIQGSRLVVNDALNKRSDETRMRGALEQLSLWLEQATQEGRAALNSLRSSIGLRSDLAEALQRAAESGPAAGSLDLTLSVLGNPREMYPTARDEIYRIGYEAIRNAQVHSEGSRLEVEVRYDLDLVLRVRDNGKGIDPGVSKHGREGHFGVQGMQERAERIGGKLTIIGSPKFGTEVYLAVPGAISFLKTRTALFSRIRGLFRPKPRTPSSQ